MECIFCKIANKEMTTDIVYEDNKVLAFKDIDPKAPVHILIVPKVHINSIDHLEEKDKDLIGDLALAAQKIAREQKVSENGYRILFNIGKDSGQTIDHLHMHLLGGTKLPFA